MRREINYEKIYYFYHHISCTRIFGKQNTASPYTEAALVHSNIFFDNPIERLIITKLVATEAQENIIYVKAYTFFGLSYATLELKCEKDDFGVDCSSTRL